MMFDQTLKCNNSNAKVLHEEGKKAWYYVREIFSTLPALSLKYVLYQMLREYYHIVRMSTNINISW